MKINLYAKSWVTLHNLTASAMDVQSCIVCKIWYKMPGHASINLSHLLGVFYGAFTKTILKKKIFNSKSNANMILN